MKTKSYHSGILQAALCLGIFLLAGNAEGQSKFISRVQLDEDFQVFKGGLREGHAGLNYFISEKDFAFKCDSIEKTFGAGLTADEFYLKLRFLTASLHHGHTRLISPATGNTNYKMAVLDTQRVYLPFKILISGDKLIIEQDCSEEQLFSKYSVIKSINHIKAKDLIDAMLPYMPADGVNKSFKIYCLYNYFYFHYLYSLLYPGQQGINVQLEKDKTHYYIKLLKPEKIQENYEKKTGKSISQYGKQLAFNGGLPNRTAYLKIESFYKGLIEQFGQSYKPFLDSCFSVIRSSDIRTLIVDLRNNEGGGDNYENILVSQLLGKIDHPKSVISVPGRAFPYVKYAFNLSDDIQGFIANPDEFLERDPSLALREKYVAMMTGPELNPQNAFSGNIVVLMNGGSFSAANAVIGQLYEAREKRGREIKFIGEENGGDIYVGAGCAGQSYYIRLPNSLVEVDMPFLCFGTLNINYPKKRLPDHLVYQTLSDLKNNKDTVLNFAIELIAK